MSSLPAGSIQAGKARIQFPAGWLVEKETSDVKVLRSEDRSQQVTISVIQLESTVDNAEFDRICRRRIELEKSELTDGFVDADAPFSDGRRSGMFFYGADKTKQRLFSGYLFLQAAELIVIYVEGVGVAPRDHLETFRSFVSGFRPG